MSVTAEESALAERVVAKSKKEAQVDTGRLRESINKKVQRGIIVFREYFYGEYNENSTLEKNAKEMMGEVPYKIERLDEDGSIVQGVNKASSGRVATYENKRKAKKDKEIIKQLLIERRKRNAEKNENDDTDEDNRD